MDTPTPKEALARAIAKFPSLNAFSKEVGVPYQNVQQWLKNGTPAEFCPKVEKISGGDALCEQLNPKVDWTYVRNSRIKKRTTPP